MSIVTMDMSSYEVYHLPSSDPASATGFPAWIEQPGLQLPCAQQPSLPLPPDLAMQDADAFLDRMYTYQHP